jgi:release factor glutamine methyltransferase
MTVGQEPADTEVGGGSKGARVTRTPYKTVAAMTEDVRANLAAGGIQHPEHEAEEIVAAVVDCGLGELAGKAEEEITPQVGDEIGWRARLRLAGRPLVYTTGRSYFGGLTLALDTSVMPPNDASRWLAGYASTALSDGGRVHDVGTGCGGLGLLIKRFRPTLHVTGSDISADAVRVARRNAKRTGLDVAFDQADGLPKGTTPDLVVAYLPIWDDAQATPPSWTGYPRHAYDGGPGGLTVVRSVIEAMPKGTRVAVQHLPTQKTGVRELLTSPRTESVSGWAFTVGLSKEPCG